MAGGQSRRGWCARGGRGARMSGAARVAKTHRGCGERLGWFPAPRIGRIGRASSAKWAPGSATENRVPVERRVAGSNPALSAFVAGKSLISGDVFFEWVAVFSAGLRSRVPGASCGESPTFGTTPLDTEWCRTPFLSRAWSARNATFSPQGGKRFRLLVHPTDPDHDHAGRVAPLLDVELGVRTATLKDSEHSVAERPVGVPAE